MMKRSYDITKAVLYIFLLFVFPLGVYAQDDDVLFNRLDSLLAVQPEITKAKENRINMIKERLKVPNLSARQEYEINETLYQEYMAFKCEPAYNYATRNIQIAKKNGWWREFNNSTLEQVHVLGVMALFDNAERSLSTVRMDVMTREDSLAYYVCYSDLHLFGAEFTEGTPFYIGNLKAAQYARKEAIRLASPNSIIGAVNLANSLTYNKQYYKAIKILTRSLENNGPKCGTRDYSILTSDLAHFYFCVKNNAMRKHYLLLSAISDVKGAVRENNSMRELASMLMDEGDYDRAYKYINVSINDALFYGTRLRNMQTVKFEPKIIEAYHKSQVSHRHALIIVTVIISIITVLLVVVLFLLLRYLRRYHKSTQIVEDVNAKLQDTVGQLKQANNQLREDGQIKEQYLSRFMELASSLIDRHEETRKQANKLAREHKMEALFTMLKSSSFTAEDTKLFYTNFDKAFLTIYPDFPKKVNELMLPEGKFEIDSETLNTRLRILALLRLGITDNNRIAAILRSSIATINTYRSRMKALSVAKDDFENKILTL